MVAVAVVVVFETAVFDVVVVVVVVLADDPVPIEIANNAFSHGFVLFVVVFDDVLVFVVIVDDGLVAEFSAAVVVVFVTAIDVVAVFDASDYSSVVAVVVVVVFETAFDAVAVFDVVVSVVAPVQVELAGFFFPMNFLYLL